MSPMDRDPPPDDLLVSADRLTLLDILLQEEGIAASSGQEPIRPRPDPDERPLSFAQERLWYLDQLAPGTPTYNLPCAVRLTGRLDEAALRRSLERIVERHETLRTTFQALAGFPVQVIAPPAAVPLPVVDLALLPEPRRQKEAWRLTAEEAQRPFDLARGPLYRVCLLRHGLNGGKPEAWLLVILHHIAADGWSVGILLRELSALYNAFAERAAPVLPALPVQYADFAVWQRRRLAGQEGRRLLDWWRERLAGAPESLELPSDRPRPALRSQRGGRRETALPADLAGRLHALGRGEGTAVFPVLLAAFQAFLLRWTGQEDLVVGSPIANRNRWETEPLIGFFVNTLALRADLSGDPSFRALLRCVGEVMEGAHAHQDLPFERLVESLAPDRRASHTPLFQVMLAFQEDPFAAAVLPGLALEPMEVATGTAKFDLLLTVVAAGDPAEPLRATLEFSADLFDAPTSLRLLSGFAALLAGCAEDPERRLSDLPLLTESELHQVRTEWADTLRPYPRDLPVHRLFEEQARRSPGAVAVAFGDERLTYAELDARSNRLARLLRSWDVGPEVVVGLGLERSADMITALLGILKAGGAYLHLDPGLPLERLARMISGARSPVLVTLERWLPVLPADGLRILCLDRDAGKIGGESSAGLDLSVAADNLAYVSYTSGSTGEPKAVGTVHRGVVRLVREAGYMAFGSDQVFLHLAPLSFDASTLEIWGPLLNGGRLVVFPPQLPSLAELAEALQRSQVTTLWLTAGLFHSMADEHPSAFRGLRQLLAGGDILSPPHVRAVLAAHPGLCLIDGYGPTESTTFTCCAPLRSGDRVDSPIPLGRPIAQTVVRILDRHGRPVPIGAPGELCIGGDGLARAYLHQPGLTAERFVPDPCGEPGDRLYGSGDLARWLADGRIEFLGRLDRQVKVRGFRVEPGEIEAVLGTHPRVREVVVVPWDEGPVGRRLVAYVVERPSAGSLPALAMELRDWLAGRLPGYMVPSAWVPLAALPLTPNGKVDRRALPPARPDAERGDFAASRSPVEEIVAGIWEDLLGIQPAGRGCHFFEQGGHSLLATQAISRVRASFGIEIPLLALFEAPTVAGFAACVEEALGAGRPEEGEPPLREVPRDGDLPLSFSQQRLWFLDQLQPGDPLYNISAAFLLAGPLAAGAFAAAFSEVVRRHEVLCTRFAATGGEPRQVIDREASLAMPCIDLAALPPARREQEAARLVREESLAPFDLTGGAVMRVRLLRLTARGPEEHAVLVTVHHIAADGWSMGVLVREVASLYAAFAAGEPSSLPALALQYADFAVWQRQRVRGERLAAELAWWRETLAGAPPVLLLPADRPRPPTPSSRGAIQRLRFPRELADGLAALGRREGATLFMALLAAFAALLGRWTGEEDIPLATPVAGRTRVELEGLIGFFVNTLVLRASLAEDPPYPGLLVRVRRVCLGAYAHQELPFERLVEELQPSRDLSYAPLVQVMFALQNAPRPDLRLPGLAVRPLPAEEVRAKLDLSLTLEESPGGLVGSFEYATELFDATTVQRLAGHLRNLLAGIAADPERRLSDLPLLAPEELEQLLAERHGGGAAVPDEGRCVHQLFTEQAVRTPGALALAAGDRRVTYGELAGLAGGVAARLRAAGAGPGDIVATMLPRSVEACAAMLGVLEAGAAYLPLDPSSPRPRLAAVLEDARPRFRLTAGETEAIRLEETVGATDPYPFHVSGREAGPDDLAYVLYTSGSTGRPKGVAVPHRALANHVLAIAGRFELTPDDRVLQLASLTFDVAAEELYPSWIRGAAVVLEPDQEPAPTAAFRRFVEREQLTVLNLPSSFWEGWVATLAEAGTLPPPSLRLLVVGSEPVPVRALETWMAIAGPQVRTLNAYGLTEATVTSSLWEATAVPPAGRVPIGRPLGSAELLILDRSGNLAPVGVAGELHLGGVGLAFGYLGLPAFTAERFVPHPFPRSAQGGERLLRTGDLARRLPGGDFELQGRVDRQVKIRGFRIEPGEVEAALASHPDVRETAVDAREDGRGGLRLVAWVVPRGDRPPQATDLRSHLQGMLPAAMVPAAYSVLPVLPRTPSGKIDRRALPMPDGGAGDLSAAPRTPVEELLVGIWEEVLGIEGVGVGDDFFVLGGHSLAATRLISRVREALGVELPLRRVFAAPTPAALAAEVTGLRAAGEGPVARPIVPLPPGGELPISFAQQRIWIVDHMAGESPFYNQPAAVELRGRLRPGALAATFAEIVRRHEALRTVFVLSGDRPVQIVHAPRVPLPGIDLSALPEAARELEARRLALEEARRPFDLSRGPLLRVGLLRLGEDRHILLFNLHHIAGDGWSLGILMREVAALYPALAAGLPSPLPDLPVQYADYAAWQRDWLRGEVLEAHLAFWRRHLANSPAALDLPVDRPRPATLSNRGARRSFRIPGALQRELRALCRRERVTLFMLLLAAFDTLLHRLSSQDDLLVGAAVAGRNQSAVEGLIGCFINLLPLRVSLAGAPTFRELLSRVREATLGAFAHQALPLELLASELRWERETDGRPLVQVAFGVQNTPDHPAELPGLELRALDFDPGMARFELTLWVTEEADGLAASWTYSTDLFEAATVEALHGRFEALLGSIVADPETRLSALELRTPEERERAAARLQHWRQTKTEKLLAARRRAVRPAGDKGDHRR